MKKRNLIIPGGIVLGVLIVTIILPVPMPVGFSNAKAFSDPAVISFNGRGTLYACIAEGDAAPSGPGVTICSAPVETTSGRARSVLIYTPPGFDPGREYPVMYLLHGFAARPAFWVEHLLPVLDAAVSAGRLPPLIVVMPDGTIGGNGLDDPDTPCDDRGGCWYIDSNQVQYADFMLNVLPGFIEATAGVSLEAGISVLAGSSMEGFAAAYYALRYPKRFPAAALFYPGLDLRYAVRGSRLAPYREGGYKPVEKDRPLRVVNKAAGGGVLGLTEKWCYYPVFDSDSRPGPVWKENLPVWQRLKSVNPLDILKDNPPDLSASRFFLVTGGEDDFNFDDHIPLTVPLLEEAGATIDPPVNILPGGRHSWETVEEVIPAFLTWLEKILRSG